MRAAGVSKAMEIKAWTVMSAALSWAAEDEHWSIEANGCRVMQRSLGTRRRKSPSAVKRQAGRKEQTSTAAWALSPLAVERIRLVMGERTEQRGELFAARDATAVAIQYGLGMRNQEIWALVFGDLAGRRAVVREVLSSGTLDVRGKTHKSTGRQRNPPIDEFLKADLEAWQHVLDKHGFPTAKTDFILRGDLDGHGAASGHMTASQTHAWGARYLTPAVNIVAARWPEEHGDIIGATPYSLRRGIISLRIRAGEDRQVIAEECGTSVQMLEDSYSFVLKELADEGPRPVLEERARARELAPKLPPAAGAKRGKAAA
jgi:integrase